MKTPEILKLEKELGIILKPLEEGGISYSENRNHYLLDEHDNIVGLNLSENQLTDISALSTLKSLTSLNLSENQLTDISALSTLKSLTSLNLSENQLTDISALSSLTSLSSLYLSNNELTDISALSSLKNLSNLDLSNNQLTDISTLNSLGSLSNLYLNSNQLINISALSSLKSLSNLYLSNNELTDISVLSSLASLSRLDLSSNQLTDISALSSLASLSTLYLSFNQLTDISVLSSLAGLSTLYLNDNQLTDISVLSFLEGLENLNLRENQLTDISVLSSLEGLESLYLGYNQLTDISVLSSFESLMYLDLMSNQITDSKYVELVIENATLLRYMHLNDNPLPIPNSLLQDVKGLRAYFKDAKKETTTKRNTKLLFLGDGCVGKSTLLEHLKTLKIPKEIPIDSRTEGIELAIWKDILPNVKVNVWDFGGQEVMHSTHRLFLGEQAVYILVWCKESNKKCSESETHNLQYWLDFIADYGKQSIVLLVENVINNEFDSQEFPDDEELGELVNKYKSRQIELIPTQYRFDCKNNTSEVKGFRDVIKNKIEDLHDKFPIENYPANWYAFQELLEQEKKTCKTISLARYIELGEKAQVSNPEALLSFFDKTGVIGYYKNLANDTVILQMDWILDAVYTSVRLKDNPLARTKGKLIDEDFDVVWKEYQSEEKILFKQYMLKSNLLSEPYRHSSMKRNYTYLCPALFDKKSVEAIDWNEKDEYVAVKFNFVFGAIMQQLQVRILSHCHYEEEEVFYKNYICFRDKENVRVWVEMLEEEKELRIYSTNKRATKVVLNEIDKIYSLERTKVFIRNKDKSENDYIFKEHTQELFDSEKKIKNDSMTENKSKKEEPIKVFVTYSWTDEKGNLDEKHQNKVGSLVKQLRSIWNVDATFDLLTEENNFIKMMYKNIHGNDKVIIILSKGYAKKANEFKKSGVSTEYERIINDIQEKPKKYILVAFDERDKEKVPFGFQGDDIIVLKEELKENHLTENQNRLLAKLTNDSIVEIPKLSGKTPQVRKRKF